MREPLSTTLPAPSTDRVARLGAAALTLLGLLLACWLPLPADAAPAPQHGPGAAAVGARGVDVSSC